MLCTFLSSWIWRALRYTAIPYPITLAHPPCRTILIVTNVDYLWLCSGSAVTGRIAGDGHCVHIESSVCAHSDSIRWSQVSQWTPCGMQKFCLNNRSTMHAILPHQYYLACRHWLHKCSSVIKNVPQSFVESEFAGKRMNNGLGMSLVCIV